LFISECLPVLLYGLEACSLNKSDLSSIDFAFNRFFMKLFRTNNIETVKVCQFFLVYLFQVLFCAAGQKSSNRNLVFVLSGDLVKALVCAAIILPCCFCLFDFFYLCATIMFGE